MNGKVTLTHSRLRSYPNHQFIMIFFMRYQENKISLREIFSGLNCAYVTKIKTSVLPAQSQDFSGLKHEFWAFCLTTDHTVILFSFKPIASIHVALLRMPAVAPTTSHHSLSTLSCRVMPHTPLWCLPAPQQTQGPLAESDSSVGLGGIKTHWKVNRQIKQEGKRPWLPVLMAASPSHQAHQRVP